MRRHRPLKRAASTRSAKRKFIIYCEGKNTEPEYFRAIGKHMPGALVDLEIVEAAGSPMTIAERACNRATALKQSARRGSSFEAEDQVWAVFDRDTHPKVKEAFDRCEASRVEVALSDPCFELWLILHFEDFDRPDDHHKVQAALAKKCIGYDPGKAKRINFAELMPIVGEAEKRAERQFAQRQKEGDPPRRPYTLVFRLTKEIRRAQRAYQGA